MYSTNLANLGARVTQPNRKYDDGYIPKHFE